MANGWQSVLVILAVASGCFGVPLDTVAPFADNSFCPLPRCVTYEEINTLWAIPDPAFFLQCRPSPLGDWTLQQMPCAPATLFSFRLQVCVAPEDWQGCAETTTAATEPTTATTPTTVEVTTDGTEATTDATSDATSPTITPNPNPDDCGGPRCESFDDINTLWVHPALDYFYQCRPLGGIWAPIAMPCAPTTKFSFRHQVCVVEALWEAPVC